MMELLLVLVLHWAAALGLMLGGYRLSRGGGWLGSIALMGLAAASVLLWIRPVEPMIRGWIGRGAESRSILAGLVADPMGLSLCLLAALLGGAFLLGGPQLRAADKAEDARAHSIHWSSAALTLAISGFAICWLALTPWVTFAGLTLITVAGFIAHLSQEASGEENASQATRWFGESALSLVLAISGAAILTDGGADLAWNPSAGWSSTARDALGSSLMVFGTFLWLKPFPLLGGLARPTSGSHAYRMFLGQWIPGVAAMSLLCRLHPPLRSSGADEPLVWVALGTAALAALSSITQSDWRTGLSLALSSCFGLSLALLTAMGPMIGLAACLGSSIPILALAFVADSARLPALAGRRRGPDARAFAILAACLAAGFPPGLAGSAWASGAVGVETGIVILLLAAGVGRALGFVLASGKPITFPGWGYCVAVCALLAVSFGMPWTGAVSGSLSAGSPDRVFESVFAKIAGAGSAPERGLMDFEPEQLLFYWLPMVLGFGVALGLRGRRSRAKPGLLVRFVAEGYAVDRGCSFVGHHAKRYVLFLERFIGDVFWEKALPKAFGGSTRWIARRWAAADSAMVKGGHAAIRWATDASAYSVRAIQSGQLHAYLLFVVGMGLVLLLHFLR